MLHILSVHRGAVAALALLTFASALTACGGSTGGGSSTTAAGGTKVPAFATDFKPPTSGCGSFTAKAPDDPDGVVAALDAEHQSALGGYADFEGSTVKVLKSAWADWKPSHPGPYTVAVSWNQLVSDFQVQIVDEMKRRFGADKNVKQVIVKTTGSAVDVGQQLQQFNQLVQAKPDVIVLETPSADSFVGPIERAKAAGIPTVTLLSPAPTAAAVNIDGNNYLGAAQTASYVSKLLAGKGSFVGVRALAGAAVDTQVATGWDAVVKSCPGMKSSGEIFGGFSETLAKSETIKFLATHPQKIDALGVLAGQSAGTLKALQQSGRPVPPMAEIGMDKAFFGYWRQNQGSYHAASASLPPVPGARAVYEVTMRMLAGQGVKLNTLVGEEPLVTDANLARWSDPSWNANTPGTVGGDPQSFLPSKFLDAFFTQPAPVQQ